MALLGFRKKQTTENSPLRGSHAQGTEYRYAKQLSTSDVYVERDIVQRSAHDIKENSVQVSQYLIFRRRRLSRGKCSKIAKVPLMFIKGGIMVEGFFK